MARPPWRRRNEDRAKQETGERGWWATMCLAVPARIERIDGDSAVVNIGGVERETSLVLVAGATVGDYVLLHAGFAIQVVDAAEAAETLRLLEELFAAGDAASVPGTPDAASGTPVSEARGGVR